MPKRKRKSFLKKMWSIRNHVCYYCKCDLKLSNASVDHLIPKNLGGTDDEENLELSCKRCNSLKSNLPPSLFNELLDMSLRSVLRLRVLNNKAAKSLINY